MAEIWQNLSKVVGWMIVLATMSYVYLYLRIYTCIGNERKRKREMVNNSHAAKYLQGVNLEEYLGVLCATLATFLQI